MFEICYGTIILLQLSGYVPPGHCLRVISDICDEQLKEVLNYYKVEVTKDDIFSRCKVNLKCSNSE